MADKYKSTKDQINKEIRDMHSRMRDPEKQEQRILLDKQKENVRQTSQRYGLD